MKITADTNLLVRIVVRDDTAQARIAFDIVSTAERVAIPLSCLCEVVWVLQSVYGYKAVELAIAIRSIIEANNAVFDQSAVEAGLRVLAAGGDFADGVIAAAGRAMGGETFVSFDRKAIAYLNTLGLPARNARDLK